MVITLTTSLAVFAAFAGLFGLVLGAYALLRSRAVVRECRSQIRRLLPDSSGLDARAVRDVAVVRYDALEEMSGARSFSLAMLNVAGDGVVVTSINGRTESRTYAKTIEQGRAAEALSPEEYRAIRAARLGSGPSDPPGDKPAVPAQQRSAAGEPETEREETVKSVKSPANPNGGQSDKAPEDGAARTGGSGTGAAKGAARGSGTGKGAGTGSGAGTGGGTASGQETGAATGAKGGSGGMTAAGPARTDPQASGSPGTSD